MFKFFGVSRRCAPDTFQDVVLVCVCLVSTNLKGRTLRQHKSPKVLFQSDSSSLDILLMECPQREYYQFNVHQFQKLIIDGEDINQIEKD